MCIKCGLSVCSCYYINYCPCCSGCDGWHYYWCVHYKHISCSFCGGYDGWHFFNCTRYNPPILYTPPIPSPQININIYSKKKKLNKRKSNEEW